MTTIFADTALRKNSNSISRFFRTLSGSLGSIDRPLLLLTLAICAISLVNIFGIVGLHNPFFYKEAIFMGVGLIVMFLTSFFNYRYLKNYATPVMIIYGGVILLLILSLLSHAIRGSHAWISLGGFSIEPSELAKLAIIVLLAKYFSQRHIHIYQLRHIIVSGIYFGIPTLIILAQPDLGSAVIVGLIWFGILMAAGINKKQFFALATLGILMAGAAWMFALKPYQKERIVAFINPYKDPTGIGYNIIQSKIAIGDGNWLGSGLGNGSQASLGFLPEAHNDFAFASLTEQFGLVGVVVTLGVIVAMLYRILLLGQESGHNFGKLFSMGLAIFIGAHVFINAAVNIGLMPITGLPFTFLSYGGSHLVSVMAGLGIMQSMSRYG